MHLPIQEKLPVARKRTSSYTEEKFQPVRQLLLPTTAVMQTTSASVQTATTTMQTATTEEVLMQLNGSSQAGNWKQLAAKKELPPCAKAKKTGRLPRRESSPPKQNNYEALTKSLFEMGSNAARTAFEQCLWNYSTNTLCDTAPSGVVARTIYTPRCSPPFATATPCNV